MCIRDSCFIRFSLRIIFSRVKRLLVCTKPAVRPPFYAVSYTHLITEQLAHDALTMIEIDDDGLDEMDKRLLEAMIYKFNGGPVGLSSLAVAVGEDASTLEDVHEPFLIMQGYISRTPRGRVAMPSAYLKMGAAPPANGQGWLL